MRLKPLAACLASPTGCAGAHPRKAAGEQGGGAGQGRPGPLAGAMCSKLWHSRQGSLLRQLRALGQRLHPQLPVPLEPGSSSPALCPPAHALPTLAAGQAAQAGRQQQAPAAEPRVPADGGRRARLLCPRARAPRQVRAGQLGRAVRWAGQLCCAAWRPLASPLGLAVAGWLCGRPPI